MQADEQFLILESNPLLPKPNIDSWEILYMAGSVLDFGI